MFLAAAADDPCNTLNTEWDWHPDHKGYMWRKHGQNHACHLQADITARYHNSRKKYRLHIIERSTRKSRVPCVPMESWHGPSGLFGCSYVEHLTIFTVVLCCLVLVVRACGVKQGVGMHVTVGRAFLHSCAWHELPYFFCAGGLKARCCVMRHHESDILSHSLLATVLCALAFSFLGLLP